MRLRLVKELDLYSQQVVESGFDARKSYIKAHMFNQGVKKKILLEEVQGCTIFQESDFTKYPPNIKNVHTVWNIICIYTNYPK